MDEAGGKNASSRFADVLDASGSIVIGPDDRSDNTASTPSVIKSLLKKPPSSSNQLAQHPKHKKTVSFNQTVIVFCEEIEGPSPSSDQYEPPVGYQDASLNAFDPPKGYRDGKNESEKNPKAENRNINNFNVLDDGLPNLEDEKIFSLLDSESIIDAFNLNYDDLSEEDLPVNYSNPGNGFLCNDTVSDDYDTNSESSISTERRIASSQQPKKSETATNQTERKKQNRTQGQSSEKSTNHSKSDAPSKLSSSDNRDAADKQEGVAAAALTPPNSTSSSSNNSRSLPARMKVTQLDASLVKRHSTRLPETNHDLNRINDDRKQIESSSSSSREQSRESPNSRSPPSVVQKQVPQQHRLQIDINATAHTAKDTTNFSTLVYSDVAHLEPIHQTRPAAQPSAPLNQTDHINSQSGPACHICRVIESNKVQSNHNADFKAPTTRTLDPSIQQRPINSQPVIFNQSCVSCRDALLRQNIPQTVNVGDPQINRPLTYQIVHVLDRTGNRVRALSLVKPLTVDGIPRDHSHRGHIGSAVGPVRVQVPLSGQPIVSQANWQNPSNNVVIPQFRLIRASTPAPQFVSGAANNNNGPGLVAPNLVNRHPTILYMRKPLETKEMCQSPDYHTHGSRVFPDPHEVRRLDGLRAPIAQQAKFTKTTAAQGSNHEIEYLNSYKKAENMQDESDDPTFGFSKRPSVKVVAASSISASSQTQLGMRRYEHNFIQAGHDTILQDSSQTLDRHLTNQNRKLKENLPSTTSLSNINSILVGNPNSLPRSSSGPRPKPTTRGMIPSNVKRWVTSKLIPAPHSTPK